ncbi:MAG: sigma 54-interacting transcriptional regulator [Myxococcota bacterium]
MKLASTAPRKGRVAPDANAYRLLVLHSPVPSLQGQSFGLGAAAVDLGREGLGPDAIVLDDEAASRRHARIERSKDKRDFVIRDLSSSNGTFLNGDRIDRALLNHGDVLRVGDHIMVVERLSMQDCALLVEAQDPKTALRGDSVAIRRLIKRVHSIAGLDDPVLITGESGSGKEHVAQELHRRSARTGPLVPVNCAAIPNALAEAELFGHGAQAFTGAKQARDGLFAAAQDGTLFLDEIGELPPPLQAKMLRVLATGEIRRVGETQSRQVSTRIIAATHVDLSRAVDEGEFRGDLYSRIQTFELNVPPLRERRSDVLSLPAELLKIGASSLSADAVELLTTYGWPFNVRELLQSLRAAAHNAGERGSALIEPEDLPERITKRRGAPAEDPLVPSSLPASVQTARDAMPSAEQLDALLAEFEGNVVRVAAFFDKDRKQIYRWIERYGLDPSAHR